MPTLGSLYSGIGGLDLGLERAGFAVRWQVENDPHALAVLRKHWPDVPKYGDVRLLDDKELAPVDLIAGGFPCQPVSIAGQKRAQADDRWLWPDFARIIGHLRPRCVLVENVTGLLRRGLGDVLRDLAALGYDAEWGVLSACAIGAPHPRERVLVVAYPQGDGRKQGWAMATANLWESSSLRDAGRWPGGTESPIDRVANGFPRRVDRLRGLGNAVPPPMAEYVGRHLIECLREE